MMISGPKFAEGRHAFRRTVETSAYRGGKTEIQGKWTVQVFVRGRREQGPIWSLPVEASFTKGPDGMWYLDDGALAERR